MTDIIKAVRQFTEAIGCTTDHYNVRQTALYIGLQLEEMAEKLEALGMENTAGMLRTRSTSFKNGTYDQQVEHADRAAMLDADADLAWVTIGAALSQGADIEGAFAEVARANMSKLFKCQHCNNGNAMDDGYAACSHCFGIGLLVIKDGNGKVVKPQNWTPPDVSKFTCKG